MRIFWGALFLLFYCTYLSMMSPAATALWTLALGILLCSYSTLFQGKLLAACPFLFLSTFDPIFLVFLPLSISNFENVPSSLYKFFIYAITIHVLVTLIPLPLISGAIYFYGIPFTVIVACLFTLLSNRWSVGQINTFSITLITLVLLIQVVLTFGIYNNRTHFVLAKQKTNFSENFITSATPGIHCEQISEAKNSNINLVAHTMLSCFLFEWPEGTEAELRSTGHMKEYFLFGEHDNLNGFLDKNSIFNNTHFQQDSPWAMNRPVMARNLWLASWFDPFFCSNIGTTIRQIPFLYPLTWSYNIWGIPHILIGKEYSHGKTLTYIGDSDPAVSFLAPYNANFLQALYHQTFYNDLLKLLILIIIVTFRFKKWPLNLPILYITGGVLLFLCFYPIKLNSHIYDWSVKYVGGAIRTPHVDNSPDSLVNILARQGDTISLEEAPVNKGRIVVVCKNKSYSYNPFDDSVFSLIFLQDGASVMMNGEKFSAGDNPLGTANVLNGIEIQDARELFRNGNEVGSVFVTSSAYIISTGSPQRFNSYNKIIR